MIVLQFDRGYLDWAKLLLRSLANNSPGETVYINSVNLFKFQIKKIQKLYSPLIIENHKIRMKRKEKGNIMISRKPYVLKEVMERFCDDRYLMLDTDMLVKKPLDSLFSKLEYSEGAFCFRTGIWDGRIFDQLRVASGVILLTKKCLPLLESWIDIMESATEISGIKKGKWYWDQITLWKTLKENAEFNLTTIEDNYFDADFNNEETVILSAHMITKKEAIKLFQKKIREKNYQKDRFH